MVEDATAELQSEDEDEEDTMVVDAEALAIAKSMWSALNLTRRDTTNRNFLNGKKKLTMLRLKKTCC